VEGMGVASAPYYAVLSLNVPTDVKPRFISRRNLGNVYLNVFVHNKAHFGGGGGLFVLPTVESWLVGVCHEVT
jgi:hypothetical protein